MDLSTVDRSGIDLKYFIWQAKLGFCIQHWDGKRLRGETERRSPGDRAWALICRWR